MYIMANYLVACRLVCQLMVTLLFGSCGVFLYRYGLGRNSQARRLPPAQALDQEFSHELPVIFYKAALPLHSDPDYGRDRPGCRDSRQHWDALGQGFFL